MTRVTKRSKPQLTASWATVDSDDDFEPSEDLEDIPEASSVSPSPEIALNSIESADRPSQPNRRRSSRIQSNRNSVEPILSSRTETSGPRRVTRRSSRSSTVEPEFIMPSVDHSLGSSWVKTTPPQVRSRRPPSATKSQQLPRKREELPQRSSQSRGKSKPKTSLGSNNGWGPSYQIVDWKKLTAATLEYVISTLGTVMYYLKPLIALIITMSIFVGLIVWVASQLLQIPFLRSLTDITTSLCSIPLVNFLPMCGSPSSSSHSRPEFDRLITVQSAFEDVLESSSHSSSLPLDMKRSEASIRDLKQVVLYSKLPSKHELVFEFQSFVDTAREASADLTRFNSRIGRAVDHIISTNKYTLQELDRLALEASSRSGLSRFWPSTNTFMESHLLQQYLRHTGAVEEQIHALILEAQALLAILQSLDDHLDVIHGIVTRDGIHIQGDRDELFAQLWTKLGGNRGSVQRLDAQLRLLREVSVYRRTAWAHVSGTTLKLQAIAAGLEDLRERVGAAEVLGDDVPLRQHVETIQMGLERLERQREESRRVETEAYRRVLDRKVPGEDRMIDGARVHG